MRIPSPLHIGGHDKVLAHCHAPPVFLLLDSKALEFLEELNSDAPGDVIFVPLQYGIGIHQILG